MPDRQHQPPGYINLYKHFNNAVALSEGSAIFIVFIVPWIHERNGLGYGWIGEEIQKGNARERSESLTFTGSAFDCRSLFIRAE